MFYFNMERQRAADAVRDLRQRALVLALEDRDSLHHLVSGLLSLSFYYEGLCCEHLYAGVTSLMSAHYGYNPMLYNLGMSTASWVALVRELNTPEHPYPGAIIVLALSFGYRASQYCIAVEEYEVQLEEVHEEEEPAAPDRERGVRLN